MAETARILVLGAAGLIGEFITGDLLRRGFNVTAATRRFTPAQRLTFGHSACEVALANLNVAALKRLVAKSGAQIVVNCLGVLQDAGGDSTQNIHVVFVERLLAALRGSGRPILLVHFSIPGTDDSDATEFARTKRAAEHRIAQSGVPYAILRPGFVLAPRAYGGSAMLRALAALPFELPRALADRPFNFIAVEDIAEIVAALVQQRKVGKRPSATRQAVVWDLMHPERLTLGGAVAGLRGWLGSASAPRIPAPGWLLKVGAWAGDLCAWLGWRPPLRSTALAELQRGISGDPSHWIKATGIAPRSLTDVLRARPATVQEKWFARLFLLKALIIFTLVIFWCVSGLIALTVAFAEAAAILSDHGLSDTAARALTVLSSVIDISVGVAIGFRRTCRVGLVAGIVVSLGYMAAAAVLTPELWIEPLGALVKTGPAIVLMLVALAIKDDR